MPQKKQSENEKQMIPIAFILATKPAEQPEDDTGISRPTGSGYPPEDDP